MEIAEKYVERIIEQESQPGQSQEQLEEKVLNSLDAIKMSPAFRDGKSDGTSQNTTTVLNPEDGASQIASDQETAAPEDQDAQDEKETQSEDIGA